MKRNDFETVIDAGSNKLDFFELVKYKDLIVMFAKRYFTIVYKQTILGPIWILLNPLISSVVFTFIFGQLAGMSTDGTPQILFYMAGNCLWGILSSCITNVASTLTANASIFGKVYFPRLVIPVSQVLTSIVNFFIQFSMFVLFYIYFYATGSPISPNITILLAPIVIVQMSVLGFGVGLIVSALTTKYRDLALAIGFGVQLWMYVTPIVYPYSSLGGITKFVVGINPATWPVEIFRYALLGSGSIDYMLWGVSIAVTLLILWIGITLFAKIERTFVDTI